MIGRCILFVAYTSACWAWGQAEPTVIRGEILGILGPGLFVASDDLVVPRNQTLIIEAGTAILFNGYFSLTVNGTLNIRGTETRRVVLSSAGDSLHGGAGAAALDWNHLEIMGPEGFAAIENLDLFFSTDGIVSEREGLRLKNVYVGQSGINRVMIGNRKILPQSNGFFQHGDEISPSQLPPLTVHQAPKSRSNRSLWWWAAAGGGALAVGGALYFLTRETAGPVQPGIIPDPPPPPSSWLTAFFPQ